MDMFSWFMNVVGFMLPAGLCVYLVVDMSANFATTQGSLWDRLIAAGRMSATKLWARLVAVMTSAMLVVDQYSLIWGTPEMQAWVKENMPNEWNLWVGLVVMVVTIWARNRTMRGKGLGL